MSGELQREVVVRFSDAAAAAAIPLQIVPDFGVYSDALVHLLLIPPVQAGLKAVPGTAVLGNTKPLNLPGGILQFSNSDTATLPVPPINSSPQFETLFAIDSEGNETSAGAHYDPRTFQVKLSRVCTAAVAYGPYSSMARMITYTPKVEETASGVKTTYGVIAAKYQKTVITYQVTPPSIDRGNATVELYRRYSYKVINRDGQFEKPPNYPTSGAYPSAAFVLDVDGSQQIERVHEIGYIDEQGRGWVETPNVTVLEPYIGDASYKPPIACRIATLDPKQYPPDIIARAADFIRSRNLGCKEGS